MVSFKQIYILVFYVFGVMLYDFLPFTFMDEFLVFTLLGYTVYHFSQNFDNKGFKNLSILFSIFLFYFFYSLAIHSNTTKSVLNDFIIQLKPFVVFYCILAINPKFTQDEMLSFRIVSIFFSLFLCLLGFCTLSGLSFNMYSFFGHQSRFATAIIATSLLYLWSSEFNYKDVCFAIFVMTIGLISKESKFFGTYVLTLALLFLSKKDIFRRFSLKTFLYTIFILLFVIVAAYQKIHFYFIKGTSFESSSSLISEHTFARPALYITSFQMFFDYFPFGSGFASFATYASQDPYSSVYSKYGLDAIQGLSPDKKSFISDTFFPCLAQFGFLGLVLFIGFWWNKIKKINVLRRYSNYNIDIKKNFILGLIIICFFFIESIVDSTFTHNRGAFVLLLFALIVGKSNSLKSDIRADLKD